ncbi:serine-rich coiled-coil domain-containing protein 2-like [Pempheris klunzingeri]|uniref:serine-rich coiled-coil domain-containing protein 2-like n=1 Tax=Pempheris klunzingeri TaxID=3127111 RepID=UPI00397EB5EF
MSAPALDDPPAMPTMVSRLPKFSSRPKSSTTSNGVQTGPSPTFTSSAATSTRLTNGFYHHPGPAGVNGGLTAPPSTVKQNGFIRVPTAFSMKWKKESETMEDGGKGANVGCSRSANNQYNSQRQQGSPVAPQRDARKPAASSAGKGRGFGYPVTSSSSPSPQSSPRTLPVSKSGPHGSKPGLTGFGQINGTKQTQNGLSGSKPRSGTAGSLRQPQGFARSAGSRPSSGPGSRSGSPFQKKPPAGRSHSSDSLGSTPPVQLTESDRFRSRSLTQVRRQPSPNLTSSSNSSSSLSRSPTVSRSYSINRAAGRGLKERTASPAQAPPRGSLAKSPITSQTPEGVGSAGGAKVQSSAASGRSGIIGASILPPSALKKPLLPTHGAASRPSGISYKLSRPSLIKQSRPLRATSANEPGRDLRASRGPTARRNSVETPSTAENKSTPDAPEAKGLSADPETQGEVSIVGETLEDMSLSSNSSLDRNDISQEYMDDFDHLGVGMLLLSTKNEEDDSGLDQSCARFEDDKVAVNGVTKAAGLCFLDDGLDWAGMRLSGDRREHQLTRLPHRRRSSQPDYHDQGGSSLDLSPSDSCGSGGTYMWDEEGLEPLGGAATTASINSNSNTTHHIGSFDSDLNSIDILNNLDSCDLDDDDLMLDADVPEDASLHSDGDGISHMAQWRMRQLCWGTQDVHNDNESDFQCFKLTEDPGNKRTDTTGDSDLILDLCPQRSPCVSPGLGVDVEELAEDCSAVRSQLEYLQRLLLQEEDADDDTLTTDTLSPEAGSSDSQVQALLQEVQQLREELRSRDRTITQLTLQLTVPTATGRCRCQETMERTDRHTQTSVADSESVASQTPWREHGSQILHSSRQEDQEPLTDRSPPPPRALPPANPCSAQPDTPAADPVTQGGKDYGKRASKEEAEERGEPKERRRTHGRSLQLPQPSKLRLFLCHTSAAATPPKTKAPRQPSHDPESNGTVKTKMAAFACGSSRLPKPKSH